MSTSFGQMQFTSMPSGESSAARLDTIKELAQRKKIAGVNEAKKLVRRLPNQVLVGTWLEQAKSLTRALQN